MKRRIRTVFWWGTHDVQKRSAGGFVPLVTSGLVVPSVEVPILIPWIYMELIGDRGTLNISFRFPTPVGGLSIVFWPRVSERVVHLKRARLFSNAGGTDTRSDRIYTMEFRRQKGVPFMDATAELFVRSLEALGVDSVLARSLRPTSREQEVVVITQRKGWVNHAEYLQQGLERSMGKVPTAV